MKKIFKSVLILVLFASGTQVLAMTNSDKVQEVQAGYLNQDELDNRVIYQTFSLFQPYEKTMYQTLANQSQSLNDMGITDLWLPPAYRSFGVARYMEGYATYDRYDLGEFPQGVNGEKATKYGTSDELKALVNRMHQSNIKSQMDLVPNQMFGLNNREAVNVTRTDGNGNLWMNPHTTKKQTQIVNKQYLGYTKGAGEGQKKYGLIKEFNKSHFIGTSLQNQGFRTLTDSRGRAYRYYGPKNPANYLPEQLKGSEADKNNQINTVDTYLSVDGWMCTSKCTTPQQQWTPILAQFPSRGLDRILASKKMTRSQYIAADGATKSNILNEYLTIHYNGSSEEKSLENHYSGIEESDQFLFSGKKASNTFGNSEGKRVEFLVGLDVDNSNAEMQKETINWMKWMLDTYNFDGYRIDAASHYDQSVLTAARDLIKAKGNGSIGYMESYFRPQKTYADSINNELMTMNYDLYFTMEDNLAQNPTDRTTDASRGKNPHLWTMFYYNNNYNTPGNRQYNPNWSFVNNHDQEKNRLNRMMMAEKGITAGKTPSFEDLYNQDIAAGRSWEKASLQKYWNDMNSVDKKWSGKNVLSQYAYMLSMKGTTPTVYYGDMYRTDAPYMSVKSPYNDGISAMLKARKKYAKGVERQYKYKTAQTGDVEGQDLIANVREGNSKDEGMAVVISDNPETNETIRVNVGKKHAGQKYKDILGRDKAMPTVDADGNITIQVKGTRDVQVLGQVGVWVPSNEVVPTTNTQSFVNFKSDATGSNMNLVLDVRENDQPIAADKAKVTLKSETTGWEFTVPANQVTAANNQINVRLEHTLFTRNQVYTIKVNGKAVTMTQNIEGATFKNGNTYSARNENGLLTLPIFASQSTYQQTYRKMLSGRTSPEVSIELEVTENGGPVDLSKVQFSLKNKTNGSDVQIIDKSKVKRSSTAANKVVVNIPYTFFKASRTYLLCVDGRVVNTGTSDETYFFRHRDDRYFEIASRKNILEITAY